MKTIAPATFNHGINIRWNRMDMRRLQTILKRIVQETPRIANEAVDYATARFLISARAGMHKGKARRTPHVSQSSGHEYYNVYSQKKSKPAHVIIPRAGFYDSRGRTRSEVKRKFGRIRTAGAGRASWNGAMRDHARASGRSTARPTGSDIISSRVTRTEHQRFNIRTITTSKLSYLRKVWPTLNVVAMRKAMTAMQRILDNQTGMQISRMWDTGSITRIGRA